MILIIKFFNFNKNIYVGLKRKRNIRIQLRVYKIRIKNMKKI